MAACALSLASLSCASSLAFSRARSSLQKGDRVDAVLFCAEALSHSADNYRAMAMLEAIFPPAIEQCRSEAEAALARSEPLRWETVARDWRSIHAMNDAVSSLPPLYPKGAKLPLGFTFTYNQSLLSEALDRAAEYRYQEGLRLLRGSGRPAARAAYASLQKAQGFRQGYRDSEALLAQAWEEGSDRLALVPFDSDPRSADALSLLDGLYEAGQYALVQAARTRDFLQVVERGRVEATLARQGLGLDELVDARNRARVEAMFGANILVLARLVYFSEGPSRTSSRREESRVGADGQGREGEPPGEGHGRGARGGTATIFSKRLTLRATIAYRAIDIERSVVLDSRRISAEVHDDSEWATWQGDREAMPDRYAKLLEAREPFDYRPLAQRLAERLGRELAASFIASR